MWYAPRPFGPCRGQTACRDDGTTCLACGRGLAEIERVRQLIDLVCEQDYDKVGGFTACVAARVEKRLRHRRSDAAVGA